jgi:hypothetical protein
MRAIYAGAILALVATQVHAQQGLPQEVVDGFYVTLEEVRENSRQTFLAFAGPGGGPVSRDQFVGTSLPERIGPPGRNPTLLDKLFGLLDSDNDGKLTMAEWEKQINKDLAFADENDDGRITLKELANARENIGLGDAIGMIF